MKFTKLFATVFASLVAANSVAFAAADDMATMKARLDEMEKRLSDVETQNILQNVIWSGVLINRYEHFTNNNMTSTDTLDGYSTAVAINGDFTINEKTKVYTTIAMSKFWNLEGRNESWPNWKKSEEGSYQMNGSAPYFDRAYLAYKFDIPLTFSIGRMPTNNGMPINQLDGIARQGTYPRFAYNAIFDGAALSYDFKLPEGHPLSASFFYTPWVNVDPYDRTHQWQDTNNGNYKTGTTPQYTFLADYAYTGSSLFKKFSAEYMWYNYQNFYWWGDNPSSPKTANNNQTITGGPNRYDGTANMLYLGLDDIAMTGISGSVSTQLYGSHYVDGNPPKDTWASSYLFSLSKAFGANGRTIIGAEYINTDKYYYLDESAALELIPFYSQPNSKGYHIFATQRLTNNIGLRMGYYRLITKSDTDAAISAADYNSYYAHLRVDF